VSRRLNLATTPFVNESLPGLLVGAACVLALGATLYHAFAVSRLLSPSTSVRAKEVKAMDAELGQLRKEEPVLRAQRPEPAAVKEWGQLKEIVDQRALGWTDLFARLEDVLPRNVKLVSVAPRALQSRPEFADAVPTGVAETANGAGSEFKYTMRYRPDRAVALPSASPSPTDEEEGASGEGEPAETPAAPSGAP
jgi:hypothetical protein